MFSLLRAVSPVGDALLNHVRPIGPRRRSCRGRVDGRVLPSRRQRSARAARLDMGTRADQTRYCRRLYDIIVIIIVIIVVVIIVVIIFEGEIIAFRRDL